MIKLRLQAFGKGNVGLVFRVRSPREMFLAVLDGVEDAVRLYRVDKGTPVELQSAKHSPTYTEGQWSRIRVETTHGLIRVSTASEQGPWTLHIE